MDEENQSCFQVSAYTFIECMRAKLLQSCPTPWTVAHQASLSMGFSRQEYWSGFLYPPPGVLPNPAISPVSLTSPALAGGFFTTSATWEAHTFIEFMAPY